MLHCINPRGADSSVFINTVATLVALTPSCSEQFAWIDILTWYNPHTAISQMTMLRPGETKNAANITVQVEGPLPTQGVREVSGFSTFWTTGWQVFFIRDPSRILSFSLWYASYSFLHHPNLTWALVKIPTTGDWQTSLVPLSSPPPQHTHLYSQDLSAWRFFRHPPY